ncbi:MAG: class B sortase [Oscillospiraceae bacterium]
MNVKHKLVISIITMVILICVLVYYLMVRSTKQVSETPPQHLNNVIGLSTGELSLGESETTIGESEQPIIENEPMSTTTITTTPITSVTTPTTTSATTITTITTPQNTEVDYEEIQRASLNDDNMSENVSADADIRGWVYIANTNINYPFTQADDNQYYLEHDIYGNYDGNGAIFMDWKNNFDDFGQQSDLLTLYGHNMSDGSMFSNLKKYRNDYSFYDTNPIIEISSTYTVSYYKIFACLICSGTGGSDFEFWKYNDLSDPNVFNDYVGTARYKSIFNTAVDVQYGDKILTLSTCNSGSSSNNDRLLVVARKLRDGEDLFDGCYRIG